MYFLRVLRHDGVITSDQRREDRIDGAQHGRHLFGEEFLQFGCELGGDRLGAEDLIRRPRTREQRYSQSAENGAQMPR